MWRALLNARQFILQLFNRRESREETRSLLRPVFAYSKIELQSSNESVISIPFTTELLKSIPSSLGFIWGDKIGQGTYSSVYLATVKEYNERVAVKIISKTKTPPKYLEKFLPREIDIIRELNHNNIVKFYKTIDIGNIALIIMEHANNGSLLDLMQYEFFLSEEKSRKYFQQLVSAVEYCHLNGIVHRDIKCDNILFDNDYNLKLCDFGFAKKIRNTNKTNNMKILSETYCGSFPYASPELLEGKPYSPEMSDIWAMGVILYTMLYGHLPFQSQASLLLINEIEAGIVFPKFPKMPSICVNLILNILAPIEQRYEIAQIKNDPWYTRNN